jgi:Tol biopolymer transport system component
LVPGDTSGEGDVFLFNRTTGQMRRISVNGTTQTNAPNFFADVASDGAKVAFITQATRLVPNDANGDMGDVVVWTRATGAITRVSVTSAGVQADGDNSQPSISNDGSRIAFISYAPNLGAPPPPGEQLVVRDTAAGKSYFMDARDGYNEYHHRPALSGNGRQLGFALNSNSTDASSWQIVAVPRGQVLHSDRHVGSQVAGLALNRDGSAYAVGEYGQRNQVVVHNQTGSWSNPQLVLDPVMSADGLRVAAAGLDFDGIWLWDTSTGKTIQLDVP